MRIRRFVKETNAAELLPNYSSLTPAFAGAGCGLSREGEGLKSFYNDLVRR